MLPQALIIFDEMISPEIIPCNIFQVTTQNLTLLIKVGLPYMLRMTIFYLFQLDSIRVIKGTNVTFFSCLYSSGFHFINTPLIYWNDSLFLHFFFNFDKPVCIIILLRLQDKKCGP